MENSDNKLIFNTSSKRDPKLINPAFTFMKKEPTFLNGSLLNKRKTEYNLNYKFQHFSSNLKDSKNPHGKKIISGIARGRDYRAYGTVVRICGRSCRHGDLFLRQAL